MSLDSAICVLKLKLFVMEGPKQAPNLVTGDLQLYPLILSNVLDLKLAQEAVLPLILTLKVTVLPIIKEFYAVSARIIFLELTILNVKSVQANLKTL